MITPHPEAFLDPSPEPPSAGPEPRPAPRPVPVSVEALLQRFDGQLRRGTGVTLESEGVRWPTGLRDLDGILGGGIPRGGLSEITGPQSGGRTSLAHALLAHATAAGEVAALVEVADAFDPGSAHAAGIELERMLWVRAPDRRAALRSVEHLLLARGFALVLMDLAGPAVSAAPAGLRRRASASRGARPQRGGVEFTPAVWPRLRKAARAADTALVVLSDARTTGSCADLALETEPLRPRFTGRPALLEGTAGVVCVSRSRIGPQLCRAPVQWGAGSPAPSPAPAALRRVAAPGARGPREPIAVRRPQEPQAHRSSRPASEDRR